MNNFSFTLDIVKVMKTVKSGDRVIVGYASTYDVDSDNIQITRQALEGAKNDLLEYSTVLFNHDPDRPIGKVVETDVDDIGLLVKIVLSKGEDEIWKKIQEGIINKFSIKGRAAELMPVEGDGQIQQINNLKLYEVSLVSVPANVDACTISHWVAKSIDLEKGVVPSHSPAKADENVSWDGSGANGRLRKWASSDDSGDADKIDWGKFATGFAWFDSSAKENFGSYKLPHHDIIDGKFEIVWKGVATAMAAMKGARGGVNVPESNRRGIYNHLAKHYKQFDKEVPEFAKAFEIDKDFQETSKQESINMNEFIEKLKVALENSPEFRKELEQIIKDHEDSSNLVEKLQVLSGKLSGDDKTALDMAIEMLKTAKRKRNSDNETECEHKDFDLTDESENLPVFQLNGSAEAINLGEGNKFRKQILKLGKWFHWDADGGILNVTEDIIENIIKNFKKGVIENVFVPITHTTDPTKNTGEVVELEKTDKGLDAIIEIKDETILEKIKTGLIKCISASLDPNYRVKTSNKFVGPTLLHAALVSEPFIKGMGSFVPLAEEFSGRSIIQLEDSEPSFQDVLKALKEKFEKDDEEKKDDKEVMREVFAEEFAKVKADFGKQPEVVKTEEVVLPVEEKKEDVVPLVEVKNEEVIPPVEIKKEVVPEVVPEVVLAEEHKEGDFGVVDSKKGKYVKEDDAVVFKALSDEEVKEIEKTKFSDCMSREMKAGKSMSEAAKTCKAIVNKEIEKMFSEETSEQKSEDESEDTAPLIDFADAERVYEGYLKVGKIVPAQKDAFIKLMTSGKALELGDHKVGVSELIKSFMESQTSSINFEENGAPLDEGKKDDEGADLSDVPADAKEFFSKMGISSSDDVKKSWTNLKQLKKEKDEEKSSLFS